MPNLENLNLRSNHITRRDDFNVLKKYLPGLKNLNLMENPVEVRPCLCSHHKQKDYTQYLKNVRFTPYIFMYFIRRKRTHGRCCYRSWSSSLCWMTLRSVTARGATQWSSQMLPHLSSFLTGKELCVSQIEQHLLKTLSSCPSNTYFPFVLVPP